ncbi:hypothetical protein N7527_006596, partial [Penicillium freii]
NLFTPNNLDRNISVLAIIVGYLIDRKRISSLGIYSSSSFLISVVKIDLRIKAIAISLIYNIGTDYKRHKASLYIEVEGSGIKVIGGTPNILTVNLTTLDYKFYNYYYTYRGKVTPKGTTANLTTYPTLSTNTKFINFYLFNDIETISPRPMLFAHSREFSENAYTRAGEPKELF